jgi:hypothetical protein
MTPVPYINLSWIRPAAHDIMLISDNRDCANAALQVIQGRQEFLKLTDQSTTKTSVSDHERIKYWIDMKPVANRNGFLAELATAIKQALYNEGKICKVIFDQEAE